MKADMAPVYMVFGLVTVAIMIGAHTAKQQLVHSPSVYLNKKKRALIPEVDDASRVVHSANMFVSKSFLRKVAHIQDQPGKALPSPIHGDIYTSPRRAETLESDEAA
ncbi:hypothetical protein Nepgr_029695 [Nepenthes gracilis]|uniref:Uncharacterized protein n=1 Tax=Nepenthes gracilis TaxID=150966 RepID=A0AAD3Y385_NEPGR|nr:hypothetical protein Nepgr_029695 [Nepenthes gracilis]